MHVIKAIAGCFLAATLMASSAYAEIPTDPTGADTAALDAAQQDACDKRVVVLGETLTHGDGHAIAFKAALARRLITQCGFKAVLWESSFYEFDHLDRLTAAGSPVTRDQVAAAIGGIWNQDVLLQPLIGDLTDRANRREISLGGFDDIWDMAGIPYTTDILPKALADRLPPAEATTCADAFHTRIYEGYPPNAPDSPHRRQQLLDCLSRIRATFPATATRDIALIDSLQRYIGRDLEPAQADHADIEHSTYINLRCLIDRLPARSKVIVWTATVHGAREAVYNGADVKALGGYIHDAVSDQALILAVGAYGGSYGLVNSPQARPLPQPAANSVEAKAMADTSASAIYVPQTKLKRFGIAPAGLFGHATPVTRDWSQTVDAAVILRDEFPMPHLPAPAQ